MSENRSKRLSKEELHDVFLESLASEVRGHSDPSQVPLEAELKPPLPPKIRVYMYNVTNPPGGRPTDEYKSQLIAPDQSRGERASFDQSDGRVVLLIGYTDHAEVFILWDAGLYHEFAYSRNVQVKGRTVFEAIAGNIATQTRHLQSGTEEVVASNKENLAEAIRYRNQLTIERLTED